MAHMLIEWVARAKVSFGTMAGERVAVGDVIDVGDWETADVEVSTIEVTGSPASTDIKFAVQTAMHRDIFANWEDCVGPIDVSTTVDGAVRGQVNPLSTVTLRKHLRFVLVHNVTTANHGATVHVWLLLKKRTP